MVANTYPHLDADTERLIKSMSKRLARLIGGARLNPEDLEQELALHLLERAGRFDPTRAGWATFVHQVVRRRGLSIIRDHHAQRRDCRKTRSLDRMSEDPQSPRLEPADECRSLHIAPPDLRIDLDQALAMLDNDTRPMVELLKHESIAEVARRLGLTRSEERKERLRICELLTRLGLNVYCGD